MKYNQLTYKQRYVIECGLKNKIKKKDIAYMISVSPSTVTREIQRNGNPRSYNADDAQRKSNQRLIRLQTPRVFTHSMKREVATLIREHWSPEQIVGWYHSKGKNMVSVQTIYDYIHDDSDCGGDLWRYCRHHAKKRKRYTKAKISIKDRTSIEERPPEADGTRFGDWEMDTIIGKDGKGAILTLTERKTNYSIIRKLPKGKNAEELAHMVWNALIPFKRDVHTITTDNGTEFAAHKKIEKTLDTKVFFTHPYSSWEKGAIENYNKLVRQYIPKQTDFKDITDEQLQQIQKQINNRPRKKIKFKTPKQEFYKQLI